MLTGHKTLPGRNYTLTQDCEVILAQTLSAPVHMFGHVFSRQPLPGGGSICEAMRGDLFV